MANLSNDDAQLVPRTDSAGRALEFDFPALRVGVAEYPEGPTGCTVFYFPDGAAAAADIRGGSAGTIMTQQLLAGDGAVDAICFAGGSLYGLEAATGVAAELFARHEYSTNWRDIALVAGAIIFDYGSRANANAIYPDKALGRAALRAARPGSFPLGRHGAGCSATVGKDIDHGQRESAGQGGAFRQVGPIKLAVFTVVNAVGAIVDRHGRVVRGHLDAATGSRRSS
ncbi:MAG TPA: P1 family peptidase, partial [Thermomicrobiales bacterium]|nr:P1 family peptidase [Thermomicrobiales bacterium]